MTSAAADVIYHNVRKIGQFKPIQFCWARMTSSLVWAHIILADFQKVISPYLQHISTYLSGTAQRVLRTIFIQKSKPKYACLPSKIVKVWIDRFCIRYDWLRRLQPAPNSMEFHWIYTPRKKSMDFHGILEVTWNLAPSQNSMEVHGIFGHHQHQIFHAIQKVHGIPWILPDNIEKVSWHSLEFVVSSMEFHGTVKYWY